MPPDFTAWRLLEPLIAIGGSSSTRLSRRTIGLPAKRSAVTMASPSFNQAGSLRWAVNACVSSWQVIC